MGIIDVRRGSVIDHGPQSSAAVVVLDSQVIPTDAGAHRRADNHHVVVAIHRQIESFIVVVGRAVKAFDPYNSPVVVIGDGQTIFARAHADGNAGNEYIATRIQRDRPRLVQVVGRAVVSIRPLLHAIAVVLDGRVIVFRAAAPRIAGDKDIALRIQGQRQRIIRVVGRARIAADPLLIAVRVVFDRSVVQFRTAAAPGTAGDVHVADFIHLHGRGGIGAIARTVVPLGPQHRAVVVVLDRQIIEAGCGVQRRAGNDHIALTVHRNCQRLIRPAHRAIVAGDPQLAGGAQQQVDLHRIARLPVIDGQPQ